MVIWFATPLSKCSLLLLFAFSFFKKEEEKNNGNSFRIRGCYCCCCCCCCSKGCDRSQLLPLCRGCYNPVNNKLELRASKRKKRLLFDFKRFFYYWTCSSLYVTYSSGSQHLVMGDPQNRIKHNLATHIFLK